jgi:hypothetical protein
LGWLGWLLSPGQYLRWKSHRFTSSRTKKNPLSFGATSLMVRSHIFAEDVFICVYISAFWSIHHLENTLNKFRSKNGPLTKRESLGIFSLCLDPPAVSGLRSCSVASSAWACSPQTKLVDFGEIWWLNCWFLATS